MTTKREYFKNKKIRRKINFRKIKTNQDGARVLNIKKDEISLQVLHQVQVFQVLGVRAKAYRVDQVPQSRKRKIYKRGGNKQGKITRVRKEGHDLHLHLQIAVHRRVHQAQNRNKREKNKKNPLT